MENQILPVKSSTWKPSVALCRDQHQTADAPSCVETLEAAIRIWRSVEQSCEILLSLL